MLVSVVIPTYNSKPYLDAAIKSVLSQTYQDLELIIIDDGSTDGTREHISDYADSRIRYSYQDNSGVSAARNSGVMCAKGAYIAFLDADDIWLNTKLEVQMQKFLEDPTLCMVYTALNYIVGSGEKRISYHHVEGDGFIQKMLVAPFNHVPFPSTVLIKKTCIQKSGLFDIDLRTGEDWDLWLRVAQTGPILYLDEVLVEKHKPDTSLTRSLAPEIIEDCHLKVLKKFFGDLNNQKKFKSYESKAYAFIYFDLARQIYYRENKKLTRMFFEKLRKSMGYDFFFFIRSTGRLIFFLKVFVRWLLAYRG